MKKPVRLLSFYITLYVFFILVHVSDGRVRRGATTSQVKLHAAFRS